MEGTVTITKNEYSNLLIDQEWRTRLEAGGVDNWEWYGESLSPSGDDFEDKENEIIKFVENLS